MEVNKQIQRKFIGCGAIHTLIIGNWRNHISVWAFGWNGKGQLGLNEEEHNKSLPMKLPLTFPKLTSVACGGDHSILISEEGEVFVTGSNEHGQLGLDNQFNDSYLPLPLPFQGKRILLAACGNHHSLFLEEGGSLWSNGDNSHGQLGLGDIEDRVNPQLITSFNDNNVKIRSIACGRYHSLAVDQKKQVWSFGSNEQGQLGLGDQFPNQGTQSFPQLVQSLNDIEEIACGCYHSIAVDVEGNLWSFGGNFEGQLGLGDFLSRNFPMKIQNFAKITKIRCGSVHSIALDELGLVWAFGNNHLGQLGLNSNENRINVPHVITFSEFPKIIEIECGAYHSVFLDVFGSFWSTGRNVGGQLGLNDVNDRLLPSKINHMSWASQYCSIVNLPI